MKVRKLAVALALAGTMGSNLAYALGLGEATVNSSLNEPLSAEIDLVRPGDLTREEIAANLAPQRDFERVGIEPMFFLNEIQFTVEKNSRGELVLKLSTRKPVREPYLNFLVEVAWPSGRLLREYALLIDPPTFREGPAEASPQVAATPARQQQQQQQQQQAAPAPSRQSASATRAQPASRDRTYGPVRPSDTLWGIAQDIRPTAGLTPQQVMLAIQDVNPDAFLSNNINLLREGSILRIPSEEAIRSRSAREAVQQVSSQNRRFQEQGAPADPAPIDAVDRNAPATASAPEVVEQGDELRLVAGDLDAAGDDGSHGGEAGGAGEGQAETSLAIAQEELDQTRRENEELNSRLEDLQSQLADMQRLVQLQSDQMASMQAMSAENDGDSPAATDAEAGEQAGDSAATEEVAQQQEAESATSPAEGISGISGEAGETGEAELAADAEAQQSDQQTQPQQEVSAEESAPATSEPTAEQAETPAEPPVEQSAAEPAAPVEPPAPDTAETEVPPTAQADGGILQKLQNNPVYQVGAAVIGLALLGLLWLLARKNARREEEFYAQLQAEESGSNQALAQESDQADGFAMGLGGAALAEPGDDDDADQKRDAETAALHASEEEEDPAAEADVYLAYGRLDQATQVLESGVARDPERQDLRLKLLAIYADGGNEEGFARHMGELEGSDDENVIAQGETLRERLAQQLDGPTIDDLESQLFDSGDQDRDEGRTTASVESGSELDTEWNLDDTTDVSATENERQTDADAGVFALSDDETATKSSDARDDAIEYDLGDLDLDLDGDGSVSPGRVQIPADEDDVTLEEITRSEAEPDTATGLSDDTAPGEKDAQPGADSMDLTDEELDGIDFSEEPGSATGTQTKDEFSGQSDADEDDDTRGDIEDLDLSDLTTAEGASETEADTLDETSAFDESFLDELDAELEKVTQEEAADTEDGADKLQNIEKTDDASALDAELEDLELDVSDEDLAFIEEVSGTDETSEEIDPAVAEDTDEDELFNFDLEESGEPERANDTKSDRVDNVPEATGSAQEPDLEGFDDSLLEVEEADMTDISEDEIGDEDDFGFLDGADEAATKLDLARAYFEMGDAEGARDILEEVTEEGNDTQKAEAMELLGKLS